MTKLDRLSRTLINSYAHDLSQQAYLSFKLKLTEWVEANQHLPRSELHLELAKTVADMSAALPDA